MFHSDTLPLTLPPVFLEYGNMTRKIISAAAILLFVVAAAGAQEMTTSWAVSRAFPGGNVNWGLPSWSQGCCDNVPSCCDSLWDNYCQERKGCCHKERRGCCRSRCSTYGSWYGGGNCDFGCNSCDTGCNGGSYQNIQSIPQSTTPGTPPAVVPAPIPAPPAPGPVTK